MEKKKEEPMETIRTRGPIRIRREELIGPIRTRGGIRSAPDRGGIRVRGGPAVRGAVQTLSLEKLIADLRKGVGHLPLTVVIHGWGTNPAAAFYDALLPWLRREDALWFVPGGGEISEMEEGVLFDLERETDRRTYDNLVGDILFFPALDESEVERVGGWKYRARAVLVDKGGSQKENIIRTGLEIKLMMYGWAGKKVLEEYGV
jgi:hypothetical protein